MTDEAPKTLKDVPGWFTLSDQLLFEWILAFQSRTQPPGDLVELGVYQGKSAIHMGRFRAPGERFTVCDLFDDARSEATIRADARQQYRTLSQESFERNYKAFHDELPTVLRGLTSIIGSHVEPGSCRFVHIDASHMYEHVRMDTQAARETLRQDGVVVFDDYRTEHTVGTSAAVWEAVIADGLKPICCSSMKFYGTWGDAESVRTEIYRRLAERTDFRADTYDLKDGQQLIRAAYVAPKKPPAKKAPGPSAEEAFAKAEAALTQADKALAAATRPQPLSIPRRAVRKAKHIMRGIRSDDT